MWLCRICVFIPLAMLAVLIADVKFPVHNHRRTPDGSKSIVGPVVLAGFGIETRFFDPDPTLFQFFATIAGYPCLAWVLSQLQRTLVR